MKPFKINNLQEVSWVKAWLKDQAIKGRLPVDIRSVELLDNDAADVQRFIDNVLEFTEERQRLQKALSARRARQNKSRYKVTTELEAEAREILLKVAESRGITTSQLINNSFKEEFLKLT